MEPLNELRRQFLKGLLALSAGLMFSPLILHMFRRGGATALAASPATLITKPIPASGEKLTAIGMGTWQTFDVGRNPERLAKCTDILRVFFSEGGGMIDSSPMYGSSEEVLGICLERLGKQPGLFSASKIWHALGFRGRVQYENSERLWGLKSFDLFQVHNLLNWQAHLETLRELKQKGKIRYVGVTTSHGRRHSELIKIMKSEPLDFIQVTYNITHPDVERDILPLALEKKIAVIANRPYDGGALMRDFKHKPLPAWAGEAGATNWAQFFLKYIVSHPAITCAIPATSKVEHMKENMSAARGALPSAEMRKKMAAYIN